MTRNRLLLGIFGLTSFILISNAQTYNETELNRLYGMGTYLYNQTVNHWIMSSGYNNMMGTPGMIVCFVHGPELDALVLGEEPGNSTNSTLELLPDPDSEHPNSTHFTLSMWYSMRPVDFFAPVNKSMRCNLLEIGSILSRALAIEYTGQEEYNLKYKFKNTNSEWMIDDNDRRPNWEFEVNDTEAGGTKMRGWQWNHIAVVVNGDKFTAYYNGFEINKTAQGAGDQFTDDKFSNSRRVMINVPINGKTCGPVGFDEVAIWNYALTEEDIFALRIHVGRNRSLDYEYNPPTTERMTTRDSTMVAESTSEGKPSTVIETTTMEATTMEATTMEATTMEATTMEATTMETTTMETTVKETTAEETTDVVSTPAKPTTVPMKTTASPDNPTKTTVPQPTTQATEYIATTESTIGININKAGKNLTTESVPIGVHNVLKTVEKLFASAPSEQTHTISDNVIDVLDKSAQYKPPPLNSSKETVKVYRDYRKAFVNLCSSVLERFEETGSPPSTDGTKFVDVMDTFLANYVNDPTVFTNESILSSAMDVKLVQPDGSDVMVDINTTVTIPQDAFEEEDGLKVVICLLKKGLQDALEPKEGDQPIDVQTSSENSMKTTWNITGPIIVMRVSNRKGPVKLKSPVRFKVHVDPALGTDPICVYKKESPVKKWSGEGVTKVIYDEKCPCVTCETNHMTNFAVLMSVNGALTGPHEEILSILTYVGCSLSLLCLVIAIILFIILRDLNSTRMGIIKNLCVALFLAQLLFLSGTETATANKNACTVVAVLLHYLFLCVITWMFCNGIYLYQKVQKATRPTSVVDLVYFCILGWGAPAVIVAITAGINHSVYGDDKLCWLSVEGSGIWAFVAPAMVIIVFNAFVTFLTMKAFVSVKVFKDKNDKDKIKSGLRAIVVMLPILGTSWIFGLLSFGKSTIFFQYLFVVFNSLQGVFLFIFHILLNEEVKGAMRRRFGKVGSSGDENMLFNKIWAFSSTGEKSTEMSSVTKTEVKAFKPVYKN